jgi:ubiquinone/menaquinone biosynthesis C-methylase UbiE
MGSIIDFYGRYDEENRLTMDNARKIEFSITTAILDKYIVPHNKILELGAGTGAYSFYYAKKGNEVVSTDLTPKHIDIINKKLEQQGNCLKLSTSVVDATDLSLYETESFEVVTCLGPMYHLTDEKDREKCIEESLRVLKPGGLLAIAYINKHYILHGVMVNQKKYLTNSFVESILNTGVNKDGDKECFFTVAFFTTPTEMEAFIGKFGVEIIDHAGTDGISSLLRNSINELSDDEYDAWVSYVISSCRDKNILGISNHGLLICKKKG